MALEGKGFYIWKIPLTEGGSPATIANTAVQAGFSHVLIKIADADAYYNVDPDTGQDLAGPVIQALRARGIAVWGWHYVYGYNPIREADIAIQRVRSLGLDGYVIDAEAEYKQPGKDAAARQFMNRLRAGLPSFPIALSSYRYPSYHPQFPWREFLEKVDLNMPQVYWLLSHNPGDQLTRCVEEFQGMTPFRPILPTGAAFKQGNWTPSTDDVNEFLRTAQSLNLSGANFWEWTNCRNNLTAVWNAISHFNWSQTKPPEDIVQQYIAALNAHDPAQAASLYNPTAVHVTPNRTIQGTQAITSWYSNLFNQVLPGGKFVLSSFSGSGSSRQFTWTATSNAGRVLNGSDTMGLANGKISYHYTFFTVT